MKRKFNHKLMHKDHYPFFERVFYRPIASLITPLVASLGIQPTMMNFFNFVVGLLGVYLIAFGDYKTSVLGALILIISYIFDCVDGQLARGLGKENKFGALIDTTLDSIKESLIFIALGWRYFSITAEPKIGYYVLAILFGQRMLGRTIPWYRLIFRESVEEVKEAFIKDTRPFLKIIGTVFSESYRSGTIWIIIFIGVLHKQIPLVFIYFIVVIYSLWLALLVNGYQTGRNG